MTEADNAHAARVNTLFSRIATVYDPLNRVFSFGMDAMWRKRLAASALPEGHEGGTVLDLAAGTLEVSAALLRRDRAVRVTAADFCLPMLLRGRAGGKAAPAERLSLFAADALRLPFADAAFDAVTLAFGLRNMRPRAAAEAEILRVLKPGGRLCVLEFAGGHEPILFGLYNLYLAHVLPLVGSLISRDKGAYRHLADSVGAFPGAESLAAELLDAGFADVVHESMTAGIVTLHIACKAT